MRTLNKLLTVLAIGAMLVMSINPAHAAKPVLDTRIDSAEKTYETAVINISSTTYGSSAQAVVAPFKGFMTAIWGVNENIAALQGSTPTIITPVVNAISATDLSLTMVSGTASNGVISKTINLVSYYGGIPPSPTFVNKGQVIRLQQTGATTNGANVRVMIEFTPDYRRTTSATNQ